MSEEEGNCDNDIKNLLKKPARALEVKNEDLTVKIYISDGDYSGREIVRKEYTRK